MTDRTPNQVPRATDRFSDGAAAKARPLRETRRYFKETVPVARWLWWLVWAGIAVNAFAGLYRFVEVFGA